MWLSDGQATVSACIITRIDVGDYDTWRVLFDKDVPRTREKATTTRVLRLVDDPNHVFVYLEFASVEDAQEAVTGWLHRACSTASRTSTGRTSSSTPDYAGLGSRETASRPRPCRDRERGGREARAAELSQLGQPAGVQARRERSGGPHAEREPIPPVLEGRVFDRHGERGVLDLAKARRLEQLAQMPFPGARKAGFVVDVRLEDAGGFPEQRQRALAARRGPRRRRRQRRPVG